MIRNLLVLIPALPLAASLLVAFGGRWLRHASHWPVVIGVLGSFVASLLLLVEVRHEVADAAGRADRVRVVGYESEPVRLWNWVDIASAYSEDQADFQSAEPSVRFPGVHDFTIDVALRADPLTVIMLCIVTFVSTLVAIYSIGYMHDDPGYPRFFATIALFVFSMTMLVSVSNFVLLYVFWEAVGACSYLLVGFWYQKPEAAAAGKKAFLVNRVGDFGFALGLFLIWTTYGSLNYHDGYAADGTPQYGVLGQTMLNNPELYETGAVATAICLLLLLGACGKSAQFLLHVWLPDAMEGPTPVSALIHAATMVTAGIYMICRCTPLFHAAPDAQHVVALVGGISALMAGIIAMTQTDLKRVLAYSTISQLGYMFLALGTGSLMGITAGMFHLFTHACFKACLFLGAGSVMHAMGGVIDMRRIGGLRRLMPVTCGTFLMASFALAGLFPWAGFWSKDEILAALHEKAHHAGATSVLGIAGLSESAFYGGLYWVGAITALLTAFYTFRAFFLTFFGEERVPPEAGHHAHESPPTMIGPLYVLAVCSCVVGLYFARTHGFAEFLQATPSLAFGPLAATGSPGAFHMDVAITSTLLVLCGIGLAAFLYLGEQSQAEWLAGLLRPLYELSYGKFFIDQIYYAFIVLPLELIARLGYWFDRYILDGLVNSVGALPALVGAAVRGVQCGLVQWYACAMVVGLLVLIGALVMI